MEIFNLGFHFFNLYILFLQNNKYRAVSNQLETFTAH